MRTKRSRTSAGSESRIAVPDVDVITVAQVVAVSGSAPQWRIVAADFSAYHTGSEILAELAERARRDHKRAKITISPDDQGRLCLNSMVLLDENTAVEDLEPARSEREGYLF